MYIARIDDDTQSNFIIEYIISILNSKLMSFYFRYSNNEFDTLFPKIRVAEFKKLPIKIVELDLQQLAKTKVDDLLLAKSDVIIVFEKFKRYFVKSFSLFKVSRKLQNWHELGFGEFIKELNRAVKSNNKLRVKEGLEEVPTLTKKDEFEWLDLFEDNKEKAQDLQNQINQTDKEINAMVYELYGLNEDEITIVENS
ncbi:TaqI-like C-terminal specificity domain-containing protein [Pseudotamlana haliotis]|uniref:TaqI-like C-terminal specificity domain-containing protein n=1 Tax=Pseudotamlana haliotis TaxID=2614804 RepID=UPI0021D27AB8|nr:TaqI-like C-terminal specificity domain-containing protein [Tamlana haliotis]